MWVLGLTGGIGSGKTAASDFFASRGITVIDADVVAREVVEPGQPAWQAIKDRYGEQALLGDQSLNRAWLREKVFSDPEERRWLESQTHPRIRASIIRQLSNTTSPYVILASPLLFESGQSQLTHHTLLIDVPEDIQLQRACQRDQNHAEQIRRIIAAQMSREERRQRAHDIADNSAGLNELHQQLEQFHQQYLHQAEMAASGTD